MVRSWGTRGALDSGASAARVVRKQAKEVPSHPPEPELRVQVPQAQFPRLPDLIKSLILYHGFYSIFIQLKIVSKKGPWRSQKDSFQREGQNSKPRKFLAKNRSKTRIKNISTPSSVSFALDCTASNLASHQDSFTYSGGQDVVRWALQAHSTCDSRGEKSTALPGSEGAGSSQPRRPVDQNSTWGPPPLRRGFPSGNKAAYLCLFSGHLEWLLAQ